MIIKHNVSDFTGYFETRTIHFISKNSVEIIHNPFEIAAFILMQVDLTQKLSS